MHTLHEKCGRLECTQRAHSAEDVTRQRAVASGSAARAHSSAQQHSSCSSCSSYTVRAPWHSGLWACQVRAGERTLAGTRVLGRCCVCAALRCTPCPGGEPPTSTESTAMAFRGGVTNRFIVIRLGSVIMYLVLVTGRVLGVCLVGVLGLRPVRLIYIRGKNVLVQ